MTHDSTWVADPNSPPSGQAVGGGAAPDLRRPSETVGGIPPRDLYIHIYIYIYIYIYYPSATRTASNAGPQGRTLWNRCWVPTSEPTAPGTHRSRYPGCLPQRTPLTTVAGHPPRGRPPTTPPPRHAAPTGHAGQGDSVGRPHPHTRAHSTLVADPNSPPSGRAVGGGGAPDL